MVTSIRLYCAKAKVKTYNTHIIARARFRVKEIKALKAKLLDAELKAVASIQALKIAIQGLSKEPDYDFFELTHHSDRGIQYCSKEYVKLLQDNGVQISMTENGDPRENAIAGRINGIIKNEYLIDYQVNNINEANEFLDAVVNLYNEERPNLSIGLLTPNQVHNDNLKTEQLWKKYYLKKDNIINPLQDINKNVNIS